MPIRNSLHAIWTSRFFFTIFDIFSNFPKLSIFSWAVSLGVDYVRISHSTTTATAHFLDDYLTLAGRMRSIFSFQDFCSFLKFLHFFSTFSKILFHSHLFSLRDLLKLSFLSPYFFEHFEFFKKSIILNFARIPRRLSLHDIFRDRSAHPELSLVLCLPLPSPFLLHRFG